jgi:hypothetical protein
MRQLDNCFYGAQDPIWQDLAVFSQYSLTVTVLISFQQFTPLARFAWLVIVFAPTISQTLAVALLWPPNPAPLVALD